MRERSGSKLRQWTLLYDRLRLCDQVRRDVLTKTDRSRLPTAHFARHAVVNFTQHDQRDGNVIDACRIEANKDGDSLSTDAMQEHCAATLQVLFSSC